MSSHYLAAIAIHAQFLLEPYRLTLGAGVNDIRILGPMCYPLVANTRDGTRVPVLNPALIIKPETSFSSRDRLRSFGLPQPIQQRSTLSNQSPLRQLRMLDHRVLSSVSYFPAIFPDTVRAVSGGLFLLEITATCWTSSVSLCVRPPYEFRVEPARRY